MPRQTTDPQDEVFNIVNEQDEVTGTALRREVHRNPALIHRAIGVLVFVRGKLLLQKRSATKDTFPDTWTCSVTGHVDAGETYEQAALRELQEEAGIRAATPLLLIAKHLFRYENETEFMTFYRYDTDTDPQMDAVETSGSGCYTVNADFLDRTLKSMPITPCLECVAKNYLKKMIG